MNILTTGMGWIDHTPGGLNRYYADYLKAMDSNGHQVRGLMTADGELTTAPIYIRDVVKHPAKLGTFSRAKEFRNVVKQEIVSDHPQIYNPHFALYSSMITRNSIPNSIPIVTHFHGPWAQESRIEDKGNKLKQTIRYQMKKNIELLSYRRSDHFIVLSEYFKRILHEEYGVSEERIHIIPGAVDMDRFHPAGDQQVIRQSLGIQDGENVLFCVRRLVQRMGMDHLIRAVEIASKQLPSIKLYIASDGPMRNKLEQLAEDLGIEEKVVFLGRITNEELVKWYQAADFSIVPTLTLEGFGLVTVEALACGTPVLGTPYGGTKEILEKFSNELLFRDSSPEAMAERIASVISNPADIPSREQCRDFVEKNYTWQQVVHKVTHVFEQAIASKEC